MVCKPNPNVSVMIWDAISYTGKSKLIFINGTLNAERYCDIISDVIPEIKDELYNGRLLKFKFQQDNAPCHTAKSVKTWFSANRVCLFEHPPSSPDLNPIEFIWG